MSIGRRVAQVEHGFVRSDRKMADSGAAIVGKQTLVEASGLDEVGARASSSVQRKERTGAGGDTFGTADSLGIAGAGVHGAGAAMPHGSRIQALFGKHDISGISAHVGGGAAVAAHSLGAKAYATGNRIAFAESPDLHTAAHEAAHVVQQRGGVSLQGGMGTAGDPYERHADAVADEVVAGRSAEGLLDRAASGATSGSVQRREVPDGALLASVADWHAGDRARLAGSFQTANLFNLAANDHGQYTQIEERRDFYRWFYNYTAAMGCTTRWALAASLVANGAHQVAHMDPVMEGAAQLVGVVNDELQGMMRIGNQVIFDNVFPKLNRLLARAQKTRVQGREALRWDMDTLAEEQTLIQPLYASVAPATIAALDNVARQQGFAGIGAWATKGARVAPGPYNRGGDMPKFGAHAPGAAITEVSDRWSYGMEVGRQFAPIPTGFVPGTPMPGVPASYTGGSELAAVDTRHNLHMLEACIDSPREANPARILALLTALTPAEQAQLNSDRSPDGTQYSHQLAECSFHVISLTRAIVERAAMTSAIPTIVGGYTGGIGPSIFILRYATRVAALRGLARTTRGLPPLMPGFSH